MLENVSEDDPENTEDDRSEDMGWTRILILGWRMSGE
jgi:hypothetical protein